MKNITVFLSENFKFLEKKFSIYLNRRVSVMSELPPLVVYQFIANPTLFVNRLTWFSRMYSKTSMTRTPMARLPSWLIRTRF